MNNSVVLKKNRSMSNFDRIRKNEIDEIKYIKKVESVYKRKIFEKFEPITKVKSPIDKASEIDKIREEEFKKAVNKVGQDYHKIE